MNTEITLQSFSMAKMDLEWQIQRLLEDFSVKMGVSILYIETNLKSSYRISDIENSYSYDVSVVAKI